VKEVLGGRMMKEGQTGPWRILVVDDLPLWADSIKVWANSFNCEVRLATNLQSAVRELGQWSPHLILLDLHMPWDAWQPLPAIGHKYRMDQRTLAFCEHVRSEPSLSHIIIAVTSVESQFEHQQMAFHAGAHRYYSKGEFTAQHLKDLLSQVQAVYSVT
jgi:CheY-like chemotaxis protein